MELMVYRCRWVLTMQPTVRTIIQELIITLSDYYQTETHATHVAWWLVEAVTKQNRLQILTNPAKTLTAEQTNQLHTWIIKHTQENFPLQYLIGSVPFGPLDILVRPPTLIPRPETEGWCAALINDLQRCGNKPLTILDMCSGSGCIGLWLAHAFPQSKVVSIDIADQALALAEENARHNNITNITFLRSNLFAVLDPQNQFDLIVSNPPYITPEAWINLSPTVKNWEDRGALVAQYQGLEIIHNLIQQAPFYLKNQGPLTQEGIARLVIEIGYDQGPAVAELCKNRGFGKVEVLIDHANRDRVVCSW